MVSNTRFDLIVDLTKEELIEEYRKILEESLTNFNGQKIGDIKDELKRIVYNFMDEHVGGADVMPYNIDCKYIESDKKYIVDITPKYIYAYTFELHNKECENG